MSARRYAHTDQDAVLALLQADRLPGLPPAAPFLLDQPLSGPGADLAETFVLVGPAGRAEGAVRCGVRPGDDAGVIWWLHGGEDFGVIASLLALARAHLGERRPLYAFGGSPDAAVLPGLPVRHRPVTVRVLQAAGFIPDGAIWYFRRLVAVPRRPPGYPLAEVTALTDPPGWRLKMTDTGGRLLATAVLHAADGTVALARLAVHPAHQGRDTGGRLLAQCLHLAAAHHATDVTARTNAGDHTAAHLLAAAGFALIDTPTVYRRP
ncbi:GNAT family N-acetyltransferase [Streptomyces sp. NBC_01077]|uniref:GNAT family N-acetyltransferase n=1 Tax=Streptomyces sp. NBC_01077 TaxID=2903746 RepID=UPI003870AD71|nr:GNAT family N-acetyltransferase [Streptomyces sp. NBC_01077]WSV43802.1 GNAT family N-acetyltransferase [Streptomyces sp. NBC_01077]